MPHSRHLKLLYIMIHMHSIRVVCPSHMSFAWVSVIPQEVGLVVRCMSSTELGLL
jgi:hypothetical protein